MKEFANFENHAKAFNLLKTIQEKYPAMESIPDMVERAFVSDLIPWQEYLLLIRFMTHKKIITKPS